MPECVSLLLRPALHTSLHCRTDSYTSLEKRKHMPSLAFRNQAFGSAGAAEQMPLRSILNISPAGMRENAGHHHALGVECPACHILESGYLDAAITFNEAFILWFDQHQQFISERTRRDYLQYSAPLSDFFGQLALSDITVGTVRGYQSWRSKRTGSPAPGARFMHMAGNVRIKNEINSVLKPILREAGIWKDIKEKKFKHLPVPRDGSGIALSKEQWAQIFEIAFEHPGWHLAGHCLRIMFRGGFGFGELRKARRKDLDLDSAKLRIVEGAKNGERVRTVNLSPSALESAKWIVERWERLGGVSGEQYLLPHRRAKELERPMVSINFSWNQIKSEWAIRQPKQARPETRQYDARVSAASLLLSNPKLSLPTIEKALGWTPSSAMRKRYYKPEQDFLREALLTLEDAV